MPGICASTPKTATARPCIPTPEKAPTEASSAFSASSTEPPPRRICSAALRHASASRIRSAGWKGSPRALA